MVSVSIFFDEKKRITLVIALPGSMRRKLHVLFVGRVFTNPAGLHKIIGAG